MSAFSKHVKSLSKTKPIYEMPDAIQMAFSSKQLRKLELLTPSQQTDLNATRVAEIAAAHQARPAFDLSKNHLTVAVRLGDRGRKTVMYLMDGQHRRAATMDIDDFPFIVSFQNTPTDDDLRELFRQINIDSHKNQAFILLSREDARMADDLYDYLRRTHEGLFADKESGRVRSIREFVDALGEPYFSKFSTFDALQSDFDTAIASFTQAVRPFFDYCYADERACCAAEFMAPLRECNLVEYLIDRTTVPWYVGKKRGARSICAALKNAVWLRYFPNEAEGKCLCCKASTIGSRNFDCGHVISVHAGGKSVVDNLRPICGNCNSSMGKRHMDDFVRDCGF